MILTTHDMDDIEQTCNRLIMIDNGTKIYDGTVSGFKGSHNRRFMVQVEFAGDNVSVTDERFNIAGEEGTSRKFICDKEEISIGEAVTFLTRNFDINDIRVKEPEIEEIVRNVYEKTDTAV